MCACAHIFVLSKVPPTVSAPLAGLLFSIALTDYYSVLYFEVYILCAEWGALFLLSSTITIAYFLSVLLDSVHTYFTVVPPRPQASLPVAETRVRSPRKEISIRIDNFDFISPDNAYRSLFCGMYDTCLEVYQSESALRFPS